MPLLRRIFSSLGLRKEPQDQDQDEELPRVRRQSLLKRSHAVLKKKRQSVLLYDSNVSLDDFADDDDDEHRFIDDGPAIRDLPIAYNLPVRRRPSVQEFDYEMQAIAQLRASRRNSARHRQALENILDEDPAVHRPEDRVSRRARYVVVNPDVNPAAPQSPHASPFGLPYRHGDPLRAIARGHVRGVSRCSPYVASPSFPEEEPPGPDLLPPAAHRPLDGMVSYRREARVHNKKDGRQSYEYVSRHEEHLAAEADILPSASSSPADSAYALSADGPVGEHPAEGITQKQAKDANDVQSAVEELLSARGRLSTQRLSEIVGQLDTIVHPRASGSHRQAPEINKAEDELALLHAAGDTSDGQLDSILQKPVTESLHQRGCLVCGDSKTTLDFPAKAPTSSCEHIPQTCSSCLEIWMTSEISTKGTHGIKCPECPCTLTYPDIQRAASPSTFTTYDNLTVRAALGELADFAWCLSPTCTSGQENHANANYMDCQCCGYKQCLSHRVPWHTDETCAEYDYRTSGQKAREEEKKTEAMLDTVSKKCPNPKGCGWRIEKIDGCDHMTCRKCRFEFCWECGASQKEIRRVGNTAHEGACRYHSRNLEVAWPFNVH